MTDDVDDEIATERLSNVEGIVFCPFTDADVVRHPLVQKIIVAYEERDERLKRQNPDTHKP